MLHIHSILSTLAGSLMLALLTGCGDPTPAQSPPPMAAAPSTPGAAPKASCCAGEESDHEATEATETTGAGAEDTAGLAELSPEDRSAAERQGVCPVEGGKLGSMGKPVKTTVNGQTVFLCCDGCEPELKKNPEKYLAKLDSNKPKDRGQP